jgi:hypothetical protein
MKIEEPDSHAELRWRMPTPDASTYESCPPEVKTDKIIHALRLRDGMLGNVSDEVLHNPPHWCPKPPECPVQIHGFTLPKSVLGIVQAHVTG